MVRDFCVLEYSREKRYSMRALYLRYYAYREGTRSGDAPKQSVDIPYRPAAYQATVPTGIAHSVVQ